MSRGPVKKLSKSSWVILAIGVGLILTLQVVAVDITYPLWNHGWEKSNFAKHYFWPLMGIAVVFCMVAPWFTTGCWTRHLLGSFLALAFAALVYGFSSFVILALYGA